MGSSHDGRENVFTDFSFGLKTISGSNKEFKYFPVSSKSICAARA